MARTLSVWSIAGNLAIAAMTVLEGLLAGITGLRPAIATAGILLLATPLLLPRRARALQPEREPARSLT